MSSAAILLNLKIFLFVRLFHFQCCTLSHSTCTGMERGMDPEVKKYFRKIVYSFSYGMLWLTANVTAGIYFGLAYERDHPLLIILFYVFFGSSLFLLLR